MQHIVIAAKQRQHISVFIAVFCCALVIGIGFAASDFSRYFQSFSWLVASMILLIICVWKRSTWMLPLVFVVGMLLGLLRATPVEQELRTYSNFIGHSVTIQGYVYEDVAVGGNREQQFKIKDIKIEDKTLSGIVWVSTTSQVEIKRGYKVELNGKIQKGFGNISAAVYRPTIISIKDPRTDTARELRDVFSERIHDNIASPEAELGVGFLVGQKSGLPEDLGTSLQIVGLTHIVVASGYNLTILVRLARRLFARISKYQATVASSGLIVGFLLVTGMSPSMSRAAIVSGISLAAWYYGRSVHPLVLLPFVAGVTAFIQPQFVWGDLGWYLSFAAFAGVMIIAPLLQHYFFGPERPRLFRQIAGETIAAQIATMPIIALSFGVIALYALPSNLLVVPLIPFVMGFVFAAGVCSFFFPPLAIIFAAISYMLLHYIVIVVETISRTPNAQVDVTFTMHILAIYYILLLAVAVYMQRKTKHDFRQNNIIE